MNKLKFSIFSIFFVLIFLVSGCTKAQNATLADCYIMSDQTISAYGESNNKVIIFDNDRNIDLYSEKSYSAFLYNTIMQTETDGSLNILNVLSQNGEYQTLMHGAAQIFLEWRTDNPQREVKQETITKLYEAIEGIDKICEKLKFAKSTLESTFDFVGGDTTSNTLVSSLNEYLKNYCALINKFYAIGAAYEKVYEEVYMGGNPTKEVTVSPSAMDIKKLVLSYEMYLSKYYYLKNIVLTNSYINRFAHEKIYKDGAPITNQSFDENFLDFIKIVQEDSNIGGTTGADGDTIFYYNAGLKKLERLKVDVGNYEKAVDVILNQKDAIGEYQKFVNDFEADVQNYQNYVMKFIA